MNIIDIYRYANDGFSDQIIVVIPHTWLCQYQSLTDHITFFLQRLNEMWGYVLDAFRDLSINTLLIRSLAIRDQERLEKIANKYPQDRDYRLVSLNVPAGTAHILSDFFIQGELINILYALRIIYNNPDYQIEFLTYHHPSDTMQYHGILLD